MYLDMIYSMLTKFNYFISIYTTILILLKPRDGNDNMIFMGQQINLIKYNFEYNFFQFENR